MAKLTWSARELAAELGVSEWLIRRNMDVIPHLRLGQRVVFPKVAVGKWLEDLPWRCPRWAPGELSENPARRRRPGQERPPDLGLGALAALSSTSARIAAARW